MKKKLNWLSYLPVVTLGLGLLIGGVRFQLQAEQVKTEVKDLKAEVKEIANEGDQEIKDLKDKDQKLEKAVEVSQVKQDNIQKEVQQINAKTDKIYELLMEQAKKKK